MYVLLRFFVNTVSEGLGETDKDGEELSMRCTRPETRTEIPGTRE